MVLITMFPILISFIHVLSGLLIEEEKEFQYAFYLAGKKIDRD